MARVISIGNQDFASIIENHCFYIDKTAFIKEWWENTDTVTLITRPRRFGKTLNMSMMHYFWSNQYENKKFLFEGLDIWKDAKYRELQGSYPVIFLSFAGIKGNDYQFKVIDREEENSLSDTVQAALKQIAEKNYSQTLIDHGIGVEQIRSYGFAFEGKRVLIGE